MTEEIIIDGVNVAGCEFLRRCVIPDNEGCKIDDSLCCDVGNCYYKQLKCLEQENNLLKQTLRDKNFVAIAEENEKLKHKIETILKRKKDNCTCEDCYNEGLWEGMTIGSYEEVARLKQTLQEIKAVAKIAFAVCDDDCGNANKFKEILELAKAEEE